MTARDGIGDRMGDQVVQRQGVVLDELFDRTGSAGGEPAQRKPRHLGQQLSAQFASEMGVHPVQPQRQRGGQEGAGAQQCDRGDTEVPQPAGVARR